MTGVRLEPARARARTARDQLPHRTLILAAGAVVLVGAVLTWLIAFSSVFGVRTVQVDGVHLLSAAEVRSAAHIANGTPLVRLDRAAILHRVEALPEVASATLRTSFPSTVVLTVTERVAIGYVQDGDGYRLVDKTGDQFRLLAAPPARLPLFAVPSGAAAQATGAAIATVAAALPAAVRAEVASIQALDPQSITLLLVDRRVVVWGSADRSADKARILPALLAQPGGQFDLTNPDMPFSR